MVLQTKNVGSTIVPPIRFEAFETRTRVVKDMCGGVQRQWRQRLYRRLLPFPILETCNRNIVAKNGAELFHQNSNLD